MSRRRPSRLPRWQEWAVYLGLGSLIATGIVWLALDQWVRIDGDFGPEHHPAEHWVLIVHGIAAYAFLIVGGAMIPVHVQLGWNMRRNLVSGLVLASICIFLALTALALYYAADEVARHWSSILHWTVGLFALPAILVHAIKGRRGR
jgi:hypothetical protein